MAINENKTDFTQIQLIGFYVGQRLFGTDIISVREILRHPNIHPLDVPSNFISGIIRLRNQSIPVLDLRKRLGSYSISDEGGRNWVLVAQVEDQVLGLVVDSVTRIFRIKPDSILPAPDIIHSGKDHSYIQGVFESEIEMLIVLNFNKLLTGDEYMALKAMDKTHI